MLLQLKSIEYLNLQRTQINTIPPKTLSNLPFLRRLDLQGNYLAAWDSETFSNVTHLDYLNLDGNRISIINETSFPFEMRSRIKHINLGNNDFLCTCDLLWFRTWMTQAMKNKTVVFVNYPQRYYCKNPTHIRLDKYNPTPESCKKLNPYVIPVSAAGSFVVVAVVVMVVVYRNRWNIRYCFYSRRRRQYQQLPGRDVNIKYDAFVSCDSRDMDWVLAEVCTFLEDELGRRLCIHERDFEGAKMIIDNIMDCMEESEKIILIISNNFARSKWCQCELKIAIDEHLESEKQVIVIIREPVYRKHMTRPLKALFDTTTYIEWGEDVNAREMFRTRLADLMGCEDTDRNEVRA
ncbi:toll-like receptor 2 [Gigantopelta aegis]|uniref:toll-like receptor 2 n=1 Tax=Gigantopelta aegis TaxID=1735272 RepID=UPI001B88D653|nr:toll-like receptor 2 [Gigantopelta aegis]